MGESAESQRLARRAWTARIAMATVVALVAVGLGLPGHGPRPAHADVPVNQPTDCVLSPDGTHVVCGGVPITPPPSPFPPPVQVGGDTDRLVRGSAATAFGPLEQEAKAVTAELYDVPNDARLLVTSRDTMRSYMFLRLLDMIDRQSHGQTLSTEEQAALSAFHDAALAQKRLAANDAIAEYDRWAHDKCNGYQPPAGFGFAPYDTAGGCTEIGQIFGGGPPTPTVDQFEAYGAALAYQQYAGSADAQAAAQSLNFGMAFAYGLVSAVAGGIGSGAIAAASPAVANAIVRAVFPNAIPALINNSARTFAGVVTRSITAAVADLAAASISTVVGVILFAAAVTAIGGVVFSQNAAVRDKLVEARDQADANLAQLAGTTAGEATLLGVFVDQTLPDLAADRSALVRTPTSPPAGGLQWDVTTPSTPAGTTQSVVTTLNWDGQQQQTFVDDGYFVTSVAGGPWVMSLELDYLGPRVTGAQFGQRRRVGIRGNKLYDHTVELPAPGGIAIIEEPVLVDSFNFIPDLFTVPLPPSTAPGPVFTARLVGNRPPAVTGTTTLYLQDGQSALTGPAPGVLAAVTDPDHDPLTVTVTNRPTSGDVIVVTSTGAFSYTPHSDGTFPDHFDVTVSDGRGGDTLVPFTVVLNRSPVLATDRAVVPPAAPFTYVCPASDPDGDPLTLQVTGAPQKGTATPELGCFRYVPNPGALGPDGFSVTASDGKGGVVAGTVNVTIGVQPAVSFFSPPSRVPEDTDATFPLSVVSGEGTPTVLGSCGSSGTLVDVSAIALRCRWSDPSPAQTISVTVQNPSGLQTTATAVVGVADTTPPSWSTFPADIQVPADAPSGSVVTYATPTAVDAASPPAQVACSFPSGVRFPVGATSVTCTATDAVGNATMRSFTVKVNPYVAPPAAVRGVASYAPVFSTSTLRTTPRALNGATIRGPIAVWTNLPVVAPGGPVPVSVTYQLLGPLGRGFTVTTVTRSISPFDLGGRTVTGYANLRTFTRGTWGLVTAVKRSDGSIITRLALFTVR